MNEIYYCLGCFHKFYKAHAQPVNCPKCRYHMVYWHTSPYVSTHIDLPTEITKQIEEDTP